MAESLAKCATERLGGAAKIINVVEPASSGTANQEIEDGVAAMAMPVRGPGGSAVAAFSVSAPAARSTELFSRITMHVALMAKEGIETDLARRVVRAADPSAQAADPAGA